MSMSSAEQLAKQFHDFYEELAPQHGYETREASRKPWDDVPENNKSLMIAVCQRILDSGYSDGSFSTALENLKAGGRVSRPVWGKGTYVVLQEGYPDGIAMNKNTAEATGEPEGTVAVFRPYLMVKLADGTFLPFIPTLDHLLAEDWQEGANESPEHPQDDLESLREDRAKLYALEAAGVDNWEGYGNAMQMMREDQD